MVRYRVGDAGSYRRTPRRSCGTRDAAPGVAEGRVAMCFSPRRRRVGRSPCIQGRVPVREAQIIQETLGRVRVRVRAHADYRAPDGATIVERAGPHGPRVYVVLEEVPAIRARERGNSDAVVCAL